MEKTAQCTKQPMVIFWQRGSGVTNGWNSVRTLAIPQQAVDLLIEEHQKHPRNQYMFPSLKTGTMYGPDAFRRIHDKIRKAIGAEHIRFHDMRNPYVKPKTKNMRIFLENAIHTPQISGRLLLHSGLASA